VVLLRVLDVIGVPIRVGGKSDMGVGVLNVIGVPIRVGGKSEMGLGVLNVIGVPIRVGGKSEMGLGVLNVIGVPIRVGGKSSSRDSARFSRTGYGLCDNCEYPGESFWRPRKMFLTLYWRDGLKGSLGVNVLHSIFFSLL